MLIALLAWIDAQSGSILKTRLTCGSEPARESGVSGNEEAECADAIAGKPAPTVFAVYPLFLQHQENLWGLACQR